MTNDFLSHQALGKDILAHHGVLGMKWGHRKPSSESEEGTAGPTRKEKIKASDAAILQARQRQGNREAKVDSQYYTDRIKLGHKAAGSAYDRNIKIAMLHSDADLAAKSTHGEKIINGVGFAALGVSFAALTAFHVAATA